MKLKVEPDNPLVPRRDTETDARVDRFQPIIERMRVLKSANSDLVYERLIKLLPDTPMEITRVVNAYMNHTAMCWAFSDENVDRVEAAVSRLESILTLTETVAE
jgi:hypothetical protein